MTFALTSPLTGGAQTGFTSPTYTLVSDLAPDVNGKAYVVTALGGTQAGVTAHSVGSPFGLTWWRQKVFKTLGKTNPSTGLLPSVPFNRQKLVTRKGLTPLAGQPVSVGTITTIIEIPAGADTADAPNVRAMISAHVGALSNQSSGIGDTIVTGVVG